MAHLHTSGPIPPAGEHVMEIFTKLVFPKFPGMLVKKLAVVIDVPPVGLYGPAAQIA